MGFMGKFMGLWQWIFLSLVLKFFGTLAIVAPIKVLMIEFLNILRMPELLRKTLTVLSRGAGGKVVQPLSAECTTRQWNGSISKACTWLLSPKEQ